MYKAAEALKTFFSGFGLAAFAQDSVPDGEPLPYITYSVNIPEWDQKASMYAQVHDRTKSNAGIMRKADQITTEIGTQGKIIPIPGTGYLVIWPENPLTQVLVDGDYRSVYINLSINAYQIPGT